MIVYYDELALVYPLDLEMELRNDTPNVRGSLGGKSERSMCNRNWEMTKEMWGTLNPKLLEYFNNIFYI